MRGLLSLASTRKLQQLNHLVKTYCGNYGKSGCFQEEAELLSVQGIAHPASVQGVVLADL